VYNWQLDEKMTINYVIGGKKLSRTQWEFVFWIEWNWRNVCFSPHVYRRKFFLTRIQCNSIDYSQHGFNLFIFRLVIWNIWSGTDRIRVCVCVYAAANTKWTHSLLDDERNKKKRCNCSLFNFSGSSIMIKQQ
jgi:hypothetical protein